MAKKTQKLPVADDVLGVTTWSVFLRTHAALVRTIEREVEEATGLPLSWYDVLLELNAAEKGRLRMQELAARVLLSRTRVSRLVDDIESAPAWSAGSPTPDDGRATLAAITDLGRKELRRAAPVYLGRIQDHFAAHLTNQQLRAIRDGLEQVLAAHEHTEP
jgi:DNA-binding MarR family transcriptional regulator